MTRDTCRMATCDNDPRGGGGFAGKFCSDMCEVKFEHLRADARDAERADRREHEQEVADAW